MSRYDFFIAIWETIPYFFSEVDPENLKDYVDIDHSPTKLLFSVTFFTTYPVKNNANKSNVDDENDVDEFNRFNRSEFESKLKKFKTMLIRLGIIDMKDLIPPKINDYDRKYFFMLPPDIALRLTD